MVASTSGNLTKILGAKLGRVGSAGGRLGWGLFTDPKKLETTGFSHPRKEEKENHPEFHCFGTISFWVAPRNYSRPMANKNKHIQNELYNKRFSNHHVWYRCQIYSV